MKKILVALLVLFCLGAATSLFFLPNTRLGLAIFWGSALLGYATAIAVLRSRKAS